MKKFLALILSLAMVFALVACGDEKTDDSQNNDGDPSSDSPVAITLATGGTSGNYYAVGGVLKTVLDSKLTLSKLSVESTGASVANVNMITDGDAQMAILQSDVINYAHEGTNSFDGAPETNALWVAGIYNETVQILAKPGINSVADLKGKTVGTPGRKGETWYALQLAMSTASLTESDLTIQDIGYTQQAAPVGGADALVQTQLKIKQTRRVDQIYFYAVILDRRYGQRQGCAALGLLGVVIAYGVPVFHTAQAVGALGGKQQRFGEAGFPGAAVARYEDVSDVIVCVIHKQQPSFPPCAKRMAATYTKILSQSRRFLKIML